MPANSGMIIGHYQRTVESPHGDYRGLRRGIVVIVAKGLGSLLTDTVVPGPRQLPDTDN